MKNSLLMIILFGLCLMSFSHAENNLGYQGKSNAGLSPQELLSKLESDTEVEIKIVRKWTIATSNVQKTIWSFPPQNHPAYPSYVIRKVIEKDGAVFMNTSVTCGAEKEKCDKLFQDFIQINARLRN